MLSELFNKALLILDCAKIPEEEWTFGGGTALSLYFHHRESKDIDIFLTEAQYLPFLSPRLNEVAREIVDDYTEASNFVKLRFPEGEIDVVVAPYLTKDYCQIMEINGRKVRLETPEEIIVKKLFYRAENLKIRDIVDITIVYRERKTMLKQYFLLIYPKIKIIEHRWDKLKKKYFEDIGKIKIFNKSLIEQVPLLFNQFLEDLRQMSQM